MILVPSLITLAIALVALYMSVKLADEVVQLTVALLALVFLFLSLVFTPWPIKLLILVTLLVSNKQGREMACPFVKNAGSALVKWVHGEKGRMCAQPCSYALQITRQQRLSHHPKGFMCPLDSSFRFP